MVNAREYIRVPRKFMLIFAYKRWWVKNGFQYRMGSCHTDKFIMKTNTVHTISARFMIGSGEVL